VIPTALTKYYKDIIYEHRGFPDGFGLTALGCSFVDSTLPPEGVKGRVLSTPPS
jgi:hypothetical protein